MGMRGDGVADPSGRFTIVVRDIAGNPKPIDPVVLDFTNCTDVSICSVQPDPGTTVECSADHRRIHATTDRDGQVSLILVGSVSHRASPETSGCMRVYAQGQLLTPGGYRPSVSVSAMDQDGGEGITMADFSLLLDDVLGFSYFSRSDLDFGSGCQAKLNGADLSRWLQSFFEGYVLGCSSIGGTPCP